MKQLTVKNTEAGGRLDKYLMKYLAKAPSSFIYKMLRKKNITLNGKKATGKEILAADDTVKLFLADETLVTFGAVTDGAPVVTEREGGKTQADLLEEEIRNARGLTLKGPEPSVVYEDEDLLFLSKPAGLLSQGDGSREVSVNDWILSYMVREKGFAAKDLAMVRPAVANRLDRNTSGLILAGKTLRGLRFLSELLRERTLEKFYLTIVHGTMEEGRKIDGCLVKDHKTNKVTVSSVEVPDAVRIETAYEPLSAAKDHTLVKVELITGKSHQIRAHLASEGYPVIGDSKYGRGGKNSREEKYYGLSYQLLHAWEIRFPEEIEGDFAYLAGKTFRAPVSDDMRRIAGFLHLSLPEEV